MKLKNDFVTNSSTSSFIMVGWKLSINDYNIDQLLNDKEFSRYIHEGDYYGLGEDERLIGKMQTQSDDEYGNVVIPLDVSTTDPTLLKIKKLLDIKETMAVIGGLIMSY